MTKNEIIANIHKLESYYGTYKSKCWRNLKLYTYSSTITLDLSDSEVVGFYQRGRFGSSDETSSIQENIIGSCVETLCSKIAAQKVRPFFNTVNGTHKEMKAARQAQIFFDQLYEENNVTSVVTAAFKNACIFDKGFVKISSEGITNRLPWDVYIDPKEKTYNQITMVAEKLPKTPGRLLKLKYDIKADYNLDYTVYEYYDTMEHIKAVFVQELNIVKQDKYDANIIPYLQINYSDPIKGNTSQSVVDQLYGIQMKIDEILGVTGEAINKNPGVTFFVPKSSNIKTNMLSNRTGQVVQYDPVPGQSQAPITAVTSDIISPQFIEMLKQLKQDAYEIVGISQLSATSQKPTGLNSGVALSTMEDIESDRFETQLNNVIRLYVDIAKACIEIFPAEEEVLPADLNRSDITWADIIKARNNMKIQFSAGQSLDKDPSKKLDQLTALAAAKVIPQSHIATLMELPDLQAGYNVANNAFNAVYTFIDSVLDTGVIPDVIPEYLPTDKGQLLETEVVNTILSLAVKPAINAPDIELLKLLLAKIQEVQLNSSTNAEMYAVQSFNQELTQSMPQISAQATQAAAATMAQPIGDMGIDATQLRPEV